MIRILLVGIFSYGHLGPSYARAFRALGCEVQTFDYEATYGEGSPMAHDPVLGRLLWPYFAKGLNHKLLHKARESTPDLVFFLKDPKVYPTTLLQIRDETGALLFNFNGDNPFNPIVCDRFVRGNVHFYDCYFIWGKFLLQPLQEVGARRAEYLPFAYDPELHMPVAPSPTERRTLQSDVSFVGNWEPEREAWLKHLTGFDLAIWGTDRWKRARPGSSVKRFWRSEAKVGLEMCKVVACSKISLNFTRRQNGNAHNMRTFEIPACRGFMLTQRTEEQCEFFAEGEEIACFSSPEELCSQVERYLREPDSRNRMAQMAWKKVQPHTYLARAQRVLEVYTEMRE
jgi:hypothetical protein